MISYIQGEVLVHEGEKIIVLTSHGVGYEVFFNGHTVTGKQIGLFTSHIIKENDQNLFGFSSWREKELFELLISVNKVGPKSAFTLISTLGAEGVLDAIVLESAKSLKTAKGIGQAAANQIILSLKDKIKDFSVRSVKHIENDVEQKDVLDMELVSPGGEERKIVQEALAALTELGFKESEVVSLVRSHALTVDSSEELIKTVLKQSH